MKLPKPIKKSVFILNNFIPDTVFLLYIKLPLGGGCEKEIVRDTAKLRIIPKVPIPSEKIPNHQIFSKQNNLVRREIISGIRILLVKTDIFLKFMVAKP
jgi:hypothetical protein